ncbi:hypothetical protein Tco_1254667, partial [Tanacetum coccineum]
LEKFGITKDLRDFVKKLVLATFQNFLFTMAVYGVHLRSPRWRKMLELENRQMNFQRELELAIVRKKDGEKPNSVDNLSG